MWEARPTAGAGVGGVLLGRESWVVRVGRAALLHGLPSVPASAPALAPLSDGVGSEHGHQTDPFLPRFCFGHGLQHSNKRQTGEHKCPVHSVRPSGE